MDKETIQFKILVLLLNHGYNTEGAIDMLEGIIESLKKRKSDG